MGIACDYATVAAAVAAASPGDTIEVNAGTATWTTVLSITKGINLIGAGSSLTVITNGISGTSSLITYNPADYDLNTPFRLSGFGFDANGKLTLRLGVAKHAPFTRQTQVRIDHNSFTNGTATTQKGQAIYNFGTLYGVVDNNTFTNMAYPIAHSGQYGDDDWWSNSPQNIFALGSANYLYFEDNTFTLTTYPGDNILTDAEYSARYVFRYNTITNEVDTYSMFDMHGQQGSGMDSCFGAELYGNDINHGANDLIFFKQRSGQALVFLNNATGSTNPNNSAYTSAYCTCPTNYCSSKITHNTYWFRNRRNATGAIWGSTASGGLDCCTLEDIPTLGRDVFSETSTPGITIGTLANLPATCTVGQGYWATDQDTSDLTNFVGANPTTPISGTLYICQTTNVWTEFYTPYTYPHPLRGVSFHRNRMRIF